MMFHGTPSHMNELLWLMKQVGEQMACSEKVGERVWGLHLLEDWRTLELLVERGEKAEV